MYFDRNGFYTDLSCLFSETQGLVFKRHIIYLADYRSGWMSLNRLIPFSSDELDIEQIIKGNSKRKNLAESIEEAKFLQTIDLKFRLQELTNLRNIKKSSQSKVNTSLNKSNVSSSASYKVLDSPYVKSLNTSTIRSELDELAVNLRVRHLQENKSVKPNSKEKLKQKQSRMETNEVIEDRVRREFLTLNFTWADISKPKIQEICHMCQNPGAQLVKCKADCQKYYHYECNEKLRTGLDIEIRGRLLSEKDSKNLITPVTQLQEDGYTHTHSIQDETFYENVENFACFFCELNWIHRCTICGCESDEPITRCQLVGCGNGYHKSCLIRFPQASYNSRNQITCPYHTCHTCYAAFGSCFSAVQDRKYVRCALCPTTYHCDVKCLPAGTEFITGSWIKCVNHTIEKKCKINVNWCFICTGGGELLCCESCPAAMHLDCLGKEKVEDYYICDICEAGR